MMRVADNLMFDDGLFKKKKMMVTWLQLCLY